MTWGITVLLKMNLQPLRTISVALLVLLLLHVHALKQHLPLVSKLISDLSEGVKCTWRVVELYWCWCKPGMKALAGVRL